MTEGEWTPGRGWAKAAWHVPIRMAAGLVAIVGIAWVFNAFLNSLEIRSAPLLLTFAVGALGGALAGLILCVKLTDATGFAGRTLLPLIAVAMAVLHVAAWYVNAAVVPWPPELLLWFIGPSVPATVLNMTHFLWVEG